MSITFKTIEDFAASLYTAEVKSSKEYGHVVSTVNKVSLKSERPGMAIYKLSATITSDKNGAEDVNFEFRIPKLYGSNPDQVSINLAVIERPFNCYTSKEKIVGIGFHGIYINKNEKGSKISIGIKENKKDIQDLSLVTEVIRHLNNNERDLAIAKLGAENVALLEQTEITESATKKIELILNIDHVDTKITNWATWSLLMKMLGGKWTLEQLTVVTPYDIDVFDYERGLLYYAGDRMDRLKHKKTPKDEVWAKLNQNCMIYPSVIENCVKNFYMSNSSEIQNMQYTQDSNPMSILAQSKKLYFLEKDRRDGNVFKKVRVNSPFLDGILDPIRTQEAATNCDYVQELSSGMILKKDGESTVKVYDKDFNVIDLPVSQYLVSKVLSYECVDYKTKKIKKNVHGVYKYCKKTRYYSTLDPNDFDYIRHESSFLSAATALMPMINRNDVTRDLLAANHSTQAIPTNGSRKPIVYTSFQEDVFEQSNTHRRSDWNGVVVDISANNDIVKLDIGGSKYKYIDVKKYNETKRHTSNIYVPNVKVGDRVKKGDIIFKFNSFKDKELALGIPLFTCYSTIRGLEVEDGYVISETAAKKMMHPEFVKITAKFIHDKYRLTNLQAPEIGQRVAKDEVFFSYEEDTLSDEAIDILKGRIDRFQFKEYRMPKFCCNGVVKDIKIFMNPKLMTPDHLYYKTVLDWNKTVQADKMRILNNRSYKEKFPASTENNICDFIVEVYIECYNEFKLSDKMTNRSSNKGVCVAILPDAEMPRTMDGHIVEVVMPALAMVSRKNSFNVTECKITKLTRKMLEMMKQGKINQLKPILDVLYTEIPADKRYLESTYIGSKYEQDGFLRVKLDPFDSSFDRPDMDPDEYLDKLLEIAGIPNGGKETLIDGKTGKRIRMPLLTGWNEYYRLHFIAEEKFTASPDITYTREVLMGMGHHRNEGQKLGEQEVHALLGSGQMDFLLRRSESYEQKDARLQADLSQLLMRMRTVSNQ